MDDVLSKLVEIIRERSKSPADGHSYTRELIDAGPAYCARKLGEEAIEVVIAALHEGDREGKPALLFEAADLIYHLLVLLEMKGVPYEDVLSELQSRMKGKGKKARSKPGSEADKSDPGKSDAGESEEPGENDASADDPGGDASASQD